MCNELISISAHLYSLDGVLGLRNVLAPPPLQGQWKRVFHIGQSQEEN